MVGGLGEGGFQVVKVGAFGETFFHDPFEFAADVVGGGDFHDLRNNDFRTGGCTGIFLQIIVLGKGIVHQAVVGKFFTGR